MYEKNGQKFYACISSSHAIWHRNDDHNIIHQLSTLAIENP